MNKKKEKNKEEGRRGCGRKILETTGRATGVWEKIELGDGVFYLNDIKEPVADFHSNLPAPLSCRSSCPKGSYTAVFHPPAYTRTHVAFQARVSEFRAIV